MAAARGQKSPISGQNKMESYENNYNRDSSECVPPNSRLFVLCEKSIIEDEFRTTFKQFGEIEDIWIVKDKNTGEPKGVTYIKFSKTSQAVEALENMNGVILPNHSKPLKVLIASNRSDGSRRDPNESERLVRLFVVVPKYLTEDELRQHFKEFGDVSDVMIVKDKTTGESKGFAYVRYQKASHAARAFENCDKSFKPVFADPKPNPARNRGQHHNNGYDSTYDRNSRFSNYGSSGMNQHEPFQQLNNFFGLDYGDRNDGGRLQVYASVNVSHQQLWRLFDIVPGLEYCDVQKKCYGPQGESVVAVVKYRSMQAAMWAKDKLNDFEYPPGSPIVIREMGSEHSSSTSNCDGRSVSASVGQDIAKLADALAQAQSIIQAAGINPNSGFSNAPYDRNYCSVRLPNPQPLAPSDSPVAERLFIVCSPSAPPTYALKDVFGRFGGLIDVYILHGKKCGYVKFANSESADRAVTALHGQEVLGMRLKVMPAEPPERSASSQKRLRRDDPNF